ncbi:MAG TPA: hypothetical protein VGQ83_42110 [Polyangia bacterium]
MSALRGWPVTAALVLLAGCGQSEKLDDVNAVRTWANDVSPVAVFVRVYDPVAQSYAQPDVYKDPACPAITDDGTTLVITGECTDSTGVRWFGSANIARSGASDRALTLDGYGHSSDLGDTRTTGTFTITETAADLHSFAAHLVVEGGITTTVEYAGSVSGFYGDDVTVWNGHGTVARSGMVEPTGEVAATTVDQRLDSACSGEAVSGTTTITAGGHTVVVTYDGATDCDEQHSARWTFDGADRGLVGGVQCAAAPGQTPRSMALLGVVALALTLAVARRRARRRV